MASPSAIEAGFDATKELFQVGSELTELAKRLPPVEQAELLQRLERLLRIAQRLLDAQHQVARDRAIASLL